MLNLTPTVFVVEQDASVRALLATVIRRAGLSPKAFASAEAFLAQPPLFGPSCVVLQVATFDLTGLDVLQRITARCRTAPIIVVAAESDIPMTVRAVKAGAVEFLLKPLATDELLAAIEHAIARSRAMLGREAEVLELRSRYDSLSRREREVMTHVVAGQLNKEVGAALGISEITVKAHRGKAMHKMEAASLAELVMMAMRLELPPAAITKARPAPAMRPSDAIPGLTSNWLPARMLAVAR
jgi:FixJ family two-component response regulator